MDIAILLGAPGSGKGTAAARVAARLGWRHVSSGDLLRDAVARGTPDGALAAACMQRGDLVPDDTIVRIVVDALTADSSSATRLLDGFPRTVVQAERLDAAARAAGARVRGAVLLEVPEDVLVDRLAGRRVCPACGAGFHVRTLPPRVEGRCDACGAGLVTRTDDNPATVRTRLAVYRERTAPLIAWYRDRGLLVTIDGVGRADDVADRLQRALPP
jgi:adenylate kinase